MLSEYKWAIVGVIFFVLLAAGGIVSCMKVVHIAPGHVGVMVKKCGGGGVDETPLQTGYHWRELFCEEVVEYPISMQSLILTKNPHEGEGDEVDQSITVTSSEGLNISLDVALNFTLDAAKVPSIYKQWRAPISDISAKYIRQTIREALQIEFAKFTAEELYSSKKEVARTETEKRLIDKLGPMGFVTSQFTINRIEPPTQVVTAINAKVAMAQQAQQSQQEVKKKEAEAAQAVAVARGKADAMKAEAEGEAQAITLRAEAQAKANKILAESVTPELVEYEKVRRWNGVMPTVTGGNTPLLQLK